MTAITTIIFDVDDTLYDVSTGFTAHRNGEAVQRFMVEQLGFADLPSAKKVRDIYFERYHATAKGLTVAEQEGAFPPLKEGQTEKKPRFNPQDLSEYWAANLDYSLLGGEKTKFLQDLKECKLNLVAFSNGPRKYVKRALRELGLFEIFGDERLYAVDDVLPYCKPEKEAFEKIFREVGVKPEECIMVEDSMKNVRQAKRLGMGTILVTGSKDNKNSASAAADSEATKPGDAPVEDDPAVDIAIATVDEMRQALPGLWESPVVFEPKQ